MTRTLLTLLLGSLVPATALHADDWPQWRGPARDGHVPAGVAIPEKLPGGGNLVWHIPAGFGLASPVVGGGKVFYVDTLEGKEAVHAVDAATGKGIWVTPFEDEVAKDSQSQPGPRCTPLVDGDRVYAQATRGALHCLNATDGKVIWSASYVNDFGATFVGEKGKAEGASRHGYTGSPLIDGEHLIAEVGGPEGAGVVCFDKQTGKVVWKSQNDMPAYAAPTIATVAGARQFLAFTVEGLVALSPDDGKLLWRAPMKTRLGRQVTTPLVVGDVVIVASHELGLVGVKVSKSGDAFTAEKVYAVKDEAINFSSPVAVGEYLYGPGPRKNLMCVEAATGKQAWSKDGYFNGDAGKVHAGMLVMGGNILVLTDGGQLVLFAADPKQFREVGHLQVCGANWCIPAYVGGKLYLRDAKEVMCVQLLP